MRVSYAGAGPLCSKYLQVTSYRVKNQLHNHARLLEYNFICGKFRRFLYFDQAVKMQNKFQCQDTHT